MVFEIQTRGFSLTGALADVIEMRSHAITAGWRDYLTRIDVTLSDVNGPKGGVDKVCKIRCTLAGSEPVFAEAVALDMYEAIHSCFDKIKKRVNKIRKRALTRRHRKIELPKSKTMVSGLEEDAIQAMSYSVALEPYEQRYLLGRTGQRCAPKHFY